MSNKRGRLFVISAPSGAGKTSLVKALVASESNVCFSISYTTRPQRPGETDGRDYFFVSPEDFQAQVAGGAFLEHAEVFGNQYGTHRGQIEGQLEAGQHVVLEIDWQGARQVRAAAPDCQSIFILPPSREELARRLRGRGTDSEAVINRRLHEAEADISHWQEFDYVVVNDTFDHALERLRDIVQGRGAACRTDRPEWQALASALLAGA